MRARDRMALAWRGYWAEMRETFRQDWLRSREEWRGEQARWREHRHWQLVIKRKITGKQDPTRKDVRRAVREYRRQQRKERQR